MSTLIKMPLQIYLRQEQLDALCNLSEKEHVSLEELVRRTVDCLLAESRVKEDPLWGIMGLGASNVGNIAEAHDQYLAESETGC